MNLIHSSFEHKAFPPLREHSVDGIRPPMMLQVIRKIENREAYAIARETPVRINTVLRYAV